MDGVVRPPSAFSIMCGSPPATYATAEFVVPKSIPIIFAIVFCYGIKKFRENLYNALQRGLSSRLLFFDDDLRWANDPVPHFVPVSKDPEDGARLAGNVLGLLDRVV